MRGTVILIVVVLFIIVMAFVASFKGCGVYGYSGYNRRGWFHMGPHVYYEPVAVGTVRAGSVGGRTFRGGGLGGGK